jgi:hypothetical protein
MIAIYLFSKNTKITQVKDKCPDGWKMDMIMQEPYKMKKTRCYVPPSNVTFQTNSSDNSLIDKNGKTIPGSVGKEGGVEPHIIFTDEKWYENAPPGITRECYLQQWANQNGISWNGISNNWKCAK